MTIHKQERDSAAVPDLLLERFRLNELPRAEADRLDAAIRGDEVLRQRLGALEASDEEIGRRYPSDRLATAIRARIAQHPNEARRTRGISASSRARLALPAVVAIVTAMVLMVRPPAWAPWASGGGPGLAGTEAGPTSTGTQAGPTSGGTEAGPTSEPYGDRIKGGALTLYRRTDTGSETLADGDRVRTGDLIRVGYRAADQEYGTILSIDGRGAVTLHLPPSGARAVRLEHRKTVLLDRAYELDDAPLWERFYFITGQASFEVAPVIEAARRAAAAGGAAAPSLLSLPPGLEQSTFSLQKETKP